MGGISTSTGIFSGIDTGSLIEQLLQVAARPKILAQKRIVQLQLQQGGYLDINSRLQAVKTAASGFRTGNVFAANKTTTSNERVLTATATTKATEGAYTFLVDRLVTTQQQLSKGFADADASGLGATSFTFESAHGRIDRDVSLGDLNAGQGVKRGTIQITDSNNTVATVDLSRAATVNEVLDAINSSAAAVTASVDGGRFIVKDNAGGAITIANGPGSTTAESLGIAGTAPGGTITGSIVYSISAATALKGLNDGNGVFIGNQAGGASYDFRISVAGAPVNINIGDVWETIDGELQVTSPAVSTVGGVIERINQAMAAAGYPEVTASVHADGTRLVISDSLNRVLQTTNNPGTAGDTLGDLGLASGPVAGTITGKRILSEINSTLARNLLGGSGALGDGALDITLRSGHQFNLTLDLDASLSAIMRQIESAAGNNGDGSKRLIATLNSVGDGILLKDNTGGGGNFIVVGNDAGLDTDTAAALGVSTGPAGVASATIDSGNLQHRYVALSTAVSNLNNGRGIGTGVFRIFDSQGAKADIDIGTDTKTVSDLISEINSKNIRVKAKVNDHGDGIILYEPEGGGGTLKIKVEDLTGAVARDLNLRGEAKGAGADNFIDGSAEVTVEFDPTDTLRQVADKINASNAQVTAAIINDGTGTAPFHLSLASRASGAAGRFITRAGGLDLGLETLDAGDNARVFLGSGDPAKAVLLSSSTNALDEVIQGVSLDLVSASAEPVTIKVSRDLDGIASAVTLFIDAFNTAVSRIDFQGRYVAETKEKGPLLGDGTILNLRAELYDTVLGDSIGAVGSFSRLTQVGIKVGEGGRLEFDRDAFNRAMALDPVSVQALFTARELNPKEKEEILPGIFAGVDPDAPDTFSALGVAARVEELAKRYLDTTRGVLTLRGNTLADQIRIQQDRLLAFDAQLESKRSILQRQFLRMEEAIGRLSSQQGSLGQIQRLQ